TDEEDIVRISENAVNIIADPMYKPIFKDNVNFIELPHEAFSGRIYRDKIPNLIENITPILNELN
ncbi:MAG: oxidoreductase, partial [Clostridia bacterium]|nr:oxidoreductase [Clostridia bacterium]